MPPKRDVNDTPGLPISLLLALLCLAALLSCGSAQTVRRAGEPPVASVPERTGGSPAAKPADRKEPQSRVGTAASPVSEVAKTRSGAPEVGQPSASVTNLRSVEAKAQTEAASGSAESVRSATNAAPAATGASHPPTATVKEPPAKAARPETPPFQYAPATVPMPATPAARALSDAAPAPGTKVAPPAKKYVTIDFDGVDIQVFIKFVSELTGKNFVIDDKVRGKVTVVSPGKIAVEDVYKLFESVMDIYGIATVPAGDVIKVIPALDARAKNMELRLQREAIVPADRIVTQILPLKHADPNELKKILDPLVAKTSIVLSYPPAGMLIITDALSNIKRLQDIVAAMDVEGVGAMVAYLPLRYASANDLVKSFSAIFQQPPARVPQTGGVAQTTMRIVADERTNALIVLGTENEIAQVRDLLKLMDKEIPRGQGMIRVYYLQNASAEELVKVLNGIPQQTKATDPKAAQPTTAVFSRNVNIMADKATNALIITADPTDYLIIEDVIRQLDISRSMVYLEGLIMEVNANKSFGIGVEWAGLREVSVSDISNLGGTAVGAAGFRGASIIPQVSSSGTISMPSGFSLGVIGAGISIGGVIFPNIGAVLQAYQNDSDVRILSTPQLLTLDNEEAEITVGQNVPYVTRQDTTVGSTTNYSNYEYRDVGVTLKVTPQINKEGYVRLKLDQSVTKILSQAAEVDTAGNRVLTPTTLKRTAKTTVVVKSGETVVIGGMIQDDSEEGSYKVPLLGDIPLLGWLFKTRSTSNQRTNLFVFITPRVIVSPEEASKIKDEKRDVMQSLQEGTIRMQPVRKPETGEEVRPESGGPGIGASPNR
jgi:general secretion pathway protein D